MNYLLFILLILVYQTNFGVNLINQSKSVINIYMYSGSGNEISKIELLNDAQIVLPETKFNPENLKLWKDQYEDSILMSNTNYEFIINAQDFLLKNTEKIISTESNDIRFIQKQLEIQMLDQDNQVLATWDILHEDESCIVTEQDKQQESSESQDVQKNKIEQQESSESNDTAQQNINPTETTIEQNKEEGQIPEVLSQENGTNIKTIRKEPDPLHFNRNTIIGLFLVGTAIILNQIIQSKT